MNVTDKIDAALLACLGSRDLRDVAGDLEAVSPEEWEQVAQRSIYHSLGPLLYRSLKQISQTVGIPHQVLNRLRTIYQANTAKNLRVYNELAAVLRGLERDGVQVIVLKGAHLAQVVYGDVGLRQMNDVDILVRKTDLPKAQDRLLEMGYTLPDRAGREVKHLGPFSKPHALPVELHWTLARETDPLTIDIEGLWARANPATIGDGDAFLLCPEDLFLHQCLHAAYHHGFVLGLQPLCDVAETVGHFEGRLDWQRVRSSARRWRTGRSVHLTLQLARELLGMKLPAEVLDSFDSSGLDEEIKAIARDQIFSHRDDSSGIGARARQFAKTGRRAGFMRKAALILRTLFPSPSYMRIKYGTKPLPFCYLLQPFDLFFRYFPLPRRISGRRRTAGGQLLFLLKIKANTEAIKKWIESGSIDRSGKRSARSDRNKSGDVDAY